MKKVVVIYQNPVQDQFRWGLFCSTIFPHWLCMYWEQPYYYPWGRYGPYYCSCIHYYRSFCFGNEFVPTVTIMAQKHVHAATVPSPHCFSNQKLRAVMIFAKYLKEISSLYSHPGSSRFLLAGIYFYVNSIFRGFGCLLSFVCWVLY